MFYLMMHSTHFIYGYMASDKWLRTILIVRKETRCRHIGYSFRLAARVLLYAPCHRQDNTYHGLCYTSCGVLAGTRNSSMGPPHELMKDRSDDPSHHERILHGATSRSYFINKKLDANYWLTRYSRLTALPHFFKGIYPVSVSNFAVTIMTILISS